MENMLDINTTLKFRQIRRQKDNNSNNYKTLLTANHQDTTSFGGLASSANNFLSTGGVVKGFLLLDLCGFIIPRIVQALLRNRQEIGGLNWKAANEEAIRELLSGPMVLAVPFAAILLAKHCIGKATNIDSQTLHFLSDKFAGIKDAKDIKDIKGLTHLVSNDVEKSKKAFSDQIIDDVLKPSYNNESDIVSGQNKYSSAIIEDIKTQIADLGSKRLDYEKNHFFKKIFKDEHVKAKAEEIKKLEENITKAVKDLNDLHRIHGNNKTHITVTPIDPNYQPFELEIKHFAEYLHNYADDIVRKASKNGAEDIVNVVKAHNSKAIGGQRLLNIGAIIATAAFTWVIPKFYKINKSYPGTEGLRGKTDLPPVNKEAKK